MLMGTKIKTVTKYFDVQAQDQNQDSAWEQQQEQEQDCWVYTFNELWDSESLEVFKPAVHMPCLMILASCTWVGDTLQTMMQCFIEQNSTT